MYNYILISFISTNSVPSVNSVMLHYESIVAGGRSLTLEEQLFILTDISGDRYCCCHIVSFNIKPASYTTQ